MDRRLAFARGFSKRRASTSRRRAPAAAQALHTAQRLAPWHLPAFLIADTFRTMPIALIPMWLLGLVAASIFLAWLYDRGNRSVLLVAVVLVIQELRSTSVQAVRAWPGSRQGLRARGS